MPGSRLFGGVNDLVWDLASIGLASIFKSAFYEIISVFTTARSEQMMREF